MKASVRFDSGHLVPGAVVENVSLGLAMCAERAALFAGVALGYGKPLAIALAAPRTDSALTYRVEPDFKSPWSCAGRISSSPPQPPTARQSSNGPSANCPLTRSVRFAHAATRWPSGHRGPYRFKLFATGKCLCIFPPVGGGSVKKMVQLGSGL